MEIKQIHSLTGVRFFAALWVVCFHFSGHLKELLPVLNPLQPFFSHGASAVLFFFILSGFILSYNYFPSYQYGNHLDFIWRRFCRIWPVHMAMIILFYVLFLICFILGISISMDSFNCKLIILELLMVRTWSNSELLMNKPAWSIHAEWFAYIFIFPLAFYVFHKQRGIFIALFLPFLILAVFGLFPFYKIPSVAIYIALPFFAGAGIYQLRTYFPLFDKSQYLSFISIVGISVCLYYTNHNSIFRAGLYLCFAALIFSLSFEKCIISKILGSKLFVYGGLISYSLYMTHYLIDFIYCPIFARLHLVNPLAKSFAGVLMLFFTLALAAFFYHFIEEPSHRFLRKFKIKSFL
jgi:peptidoglycan/LPS O-acetylase OafA/YrhL